MTTPQSTQEKAQYFAQHLDQLVYSNDNLILAKLQPLNVYRIYPVEVECGWIELKPLSSISDDDAIEVARICFRDDKNWRYSRCENQPTIHNDIMSFSVETFVNHPDIMDWILRGHIQIDKEDGDLSFFARNSEGSWRDEVLDNVLAAYDFLRSKGYALPWRQYSVEQLIEMGWLRLTDK